MDFTHPKNLSVEQLGENAPYTTPGMPPLDMAGKQTSMFEFWPTWLMYLPVALQSLGLAIWHRSLTLPLVANPKLPLSGMVGVGKSELMQQAEGECRQAILSWFIHHRTEIDLAEQVIAIQERMAVEGFNFPVVCKPDIGCRGSGVKLVHNPEQLINALAHYPEGAGMLVQVLASWEPEAGVFYIRHPEEKSGRIISMAFKYTPYVVGDGVSTLRQLINEDSRASELQHLYVQRHNDKLDKIIPKDKPYKLVFSASHCRGAIFRDANGHITPALTTRINKVMDGLPEFYYGRLDIKFRDVDSFKKGENIEIVEINSASSESLHIWDRDTSLTEAIRSLLFQYRTLFRLGAKNRSRGFQPPKLSVFLSAWKKERLLTQAYPETD